MVFKFILFSYCQNLEGKINIVCSRIHDIHRMQSRNKGKSVLEEYFTSQSMNFPLKTKITAKKKSTMKRLQITNRSNLLGNYKLFMRK